ncbi:MAG: glycosyltransferase family 25 protein [Thermoguttaceae bacterium]|nr:glycosyltransferase family 25 protein [Thermoguttaceae bacterium]
MNLKYDRVVCINLDRRPEKWEQFQTNLPTDFPFGAVERFAAIDGKKCPRPDWWRGGGGAWGCYCSHRQIIEECLNAGLNSVLIFEDDAQFCNDFTEKVKQYHEALPNDAQWVYYGGQYLKQEVQIPIRINDHVYRPYNVNRTHAYGIIGADALRRIYRHICKTDWNSPHHIDHHYGTLHQMGEVITYCPAQWLVDQRGGRSDVAGREKKQIHWVDANAVVKTSGVPFYTILGCHSSGSSALAGALYHLGVHLGNTLVGAYGKPPIKGGEALDLMKIFEKAYPVPSVECCIDENKLRQKLQQFFSRRRREAIQKGTVAAGKYPQLALAADLIESILGDDLRVIWIDRNIDESIISLQKRFPNRNAEAIGEHQRTIHSNAKRFYEKLGKNAIRVTYDELLTDARLPLERIASFMGLTPGEREMNNAVDYIQADKRHVKL